MCHTHVSHMYANKKRMTTLRHECNICHTSYSRLWVRHMSKFHPMQPLGDSMGVTKSDFLDFPKPFKTLMEMDMARDLKEIKSKISDTGLNAGVDQVNLKAMKLATKLIKPAWENIRKLYTFFQDFLDLNVPLPRVLVSGYSCFLCHKCLAKEPPVPIKDRGVDLTCEGRHNCRTTNRNFNSISMDEKLKLGNDMFGALFLNIDLWIHGKKLIIAKKIDVPSEKDDAINLKYIKEKFDIPHKYHLEDINFFGSDWIEKLLRDGQLAPTREELSDFCTYCVGTYAIFRVWGMSWVEYYSVFLTQVSINERNERPNPSL